MPFPTNVELTETVAYRGRTDPATAVIDWFWHSLIPLRADVSREGPHTLRFRVPPALGLAPTHPLGGIQKGVLEVVAQDNVVTVDVTLTVTRAPSVVGALAALAGLLTPLSGMAGGLALGSALATWPFVLARRNFRKYLRAARAELETA